MVSSSTFIEKDTIEAINKLRVDYPYAATLLCYVVIERVLKLRLLEHHLCSRESLRSFGLKQAEGKLKIPNANLSADDRNDAMHSNLYLQGESDLSKESRHGKNKSRFKKAREHLTWFVENYSDYKLVEQDGRLEVKPKNNNEKLG